MSHLDNGLYDHSWSHSPASALTQPQSGRAVLQKVLSAFYCFQVVLVNQAGVRLFILPCFLNPGKETGTFTEHLSEIAAAWLVSSCSVQLVCKVGASHLKWSSSVRSKRSWQWPAGTLPGCGPKWGKVSSRIFRDQAVILGMAEALGWVTWKSLVEWTGASQVYLWSCTLNKPPSTWGLLPGSHHAGPNLLPGREKAVMTIGQYFHWFLAFIPLSWER